MFLKRPITFQFMTLYVLIRSSYVSALLLLISTSHVAPHEFLITLLPPCTREDPLLIALFSFQFPYRSLLSYTDLLT